MSDKLLKLMNELNKKGLKVKFGNEIDEKERLVFGIPEIDQKIGGLVAGNIHIVYGDVGCCKSATCLEFVAYNQKKGKRCLWIDAESMYSEVWAKKFGVDTDKLLVVPSCESAEEYLEVVRSFAKSGEIDIIVLDSISALSPHAEQYKTQAKTQEREMKEDEMALLARKMGKFIRVTKDALFQNKVCLLMVGQGRQAIGQYGNKLTLSGGLAQKFFSILILYFRRAAKSDWPKAKEKEYYIENGKERYKTVEKNIGFRVNVTIEKHKLEGCSPEGTTFDFCFYNDTQFTNPESIEIKEERTVAEHLEEKLEDPEFKEEYEEAIFDENNNKSVEIINEISKKKTRGRPKKS